MCIREMLERREHKILHPKASFSDESKGRIKPEEPCDVRPVFQQDRDRILHCESFRRLANKTQVFLHPQGDHYRTRMTHTLEVSQIARTLARGLRLNEQLVEAIALGHDLGHTPFGHGGEAALNKLMPEGFHHASQSVRVVKILERKGQGLNLTLEVIDGIEKHSKGQGGDILKRTPLDFPITLEGQLVRIADIIAYINHDIDDALRAKVLSFADIPKELLKILGETHSERITRMVSDVLRATNLDKENQIMLTPVMEKALYAMRDFLYERVYESPALSKEIAKCQHVITAIFHKFFTHPIVFHDLCERELPKEENQRRRVICDFIAGMTDRYALRFYNQMFIPKEWV